MENFKKYEEILSSKNYKKIEVSGKDILVYVNEEVRTCVFVVNNLNEQSVENCIEIQSKKLSQELDYPFADKWTVLFFVENELWHGIIDDASFFMKRPIEDIELVNINTYHINVY